MFQGTMACLDCATLQCRAPPLPRSEVPSASSAALPARERPARLVAAFPKVELASKAHGQRLLHRRYPLLDDDLMALDPGHVPLHPRLVVAREPARRLDPRAHISVRGRNARFFLKSDSLFRAQSGG
eukprot:gene16864-biopygen9349